MAVQAHATAKYVRTSAQKAGPRARPDPRPRREPRAGDAAVRAQGRRARHREGAALGDCQRADTRTASAATSSGCSSTACYANQGPSQKRIRPAPMGRAFRVVKRTAHLTVRVAERPVKLGRVRPRTGAAKTPRRAAPAAPKPKARRRAAAPKSAVRSARRPSAPSKAEGIDEGRGRNDGSESSSARIPARLQQDLALALVRRQGLREAAARGPEAARHAEEALRARRRLEDRDRARGQQAEDRHLHLAPGHHHRPQGHRSRQAEAGDPEEDEPRGLHQHPGDPEAGARRAADRRVGGDAAREARRVPPRDAQGGRIGAALRRARDQGARVGPAERRGDRALGVVPARPAAAADAARRHRLRLRRGVHDLRRDRREGVALQGRAPGAADRPRRRLSDAAPAAGGARG